MSSLDTSQKINNSSFNFEWLLNSLKAYDSVYQKLHNGDEVKDITAVDISGGKGFISNVLKCSILFKNSPAVYTTILKIPGFTNLKEAQGNDDFKVDSLPLNFKESILATHKKECDFYNILAPHIDAPVPKVYQTVDWILGQQDGCLHMEDLSSRGRCLLYFDAINLTQIKSFVKALAKMHNNIWNLDPKIWVEKFSGGKDIFFEGLSTMQAGYDPFLENCQRREELQPIIDKYRKLTGNKDFYLYARNQGYKDFGLPSVLVHGDIHPGNLMWTINAQGDVTPEIAAILDWQAAHLGSPMKDLARFLVYSTDGPTRRQAETFVFDYYLECLELEDCDVKFTATQLRKAYKLAFIVQAFFSVVDGDFFFAAIKDRESNERLKKTYFDSAVLKAIHACQDADKIIQNEFRDLYEKYGF